MLERPAGLHDADVAAVLREHWSVGADAIEYAAVGFGSHHWLTDTQVVDDTTFGWHEDPAVVAPPERDLWDLGGGGRDQQLCELHRLRWDLLQIAVCIADLHDDHAGDANDAKTWETLVTHLDPRRRWPHLVASD